MNYLTRRAANQIEIQPEIILYGLEVSSNLLFQRSSRRERESVLPELGRGITSSRGFLPVRRGK